MKKLLLIMFVMIVLFGIMYSGTIKITSPNGGENLKLGTQHLITWNSTGLKKGVKITL